MYLAQRGPLRDAEGNRLSGGALAELASRRRLAEIQWLLGFYVIGLAIYSFLPLDLTISPKELYDRIRGVALIPFAGFQWNLASFYSAAKDIVVFIPVGMGCVTILLRQGQTMRGLGRSTAMGAGIAALIEVAQLFVHSHVTSVTTVALGTCGAFFGAALMRRLLRGPLSDSPASWTNAAARRAAGVCLALMGFYALVLLLEFCSGGIWESDQARLWKRFHTMWRLPLSALYWGSEANAVGDIVRKLVFYIPLGALGSGAVFALRPSTRGRGWMWAAVLLYAAGVAFAVEMLQVYLPPPRNDPTGPSHVADVGDVLLSTAGAALGIYLAWKVLAIGGEERNNREQVLIGPEFESVSRPY